MATTQVVKKLAKESEDSAQSGQTSGVSKAGRLRLKVVEELIATEQTYLTNLDNLIQYFMQPLQASKSHPKALISAAEHSTLFPSDINTIHHLHTQLLEQLTKVEDSSDIGALFVRYGPLFKMYQNYMNNHHKAVQCLSAISAKNRKFVDWSNQQRIKCNGNALDSLLICPIQRIPRYQLLLRELIKRTEQLDSQHGDLHDLRNAYEQIAEVAQIINERMKDNDRRQKVGVIEARFDKGLREKLGHSLVEPARFFVAESSDDINGDECIIRHHKNGVQSHVVVFVFNDCLLYGHYDFGNKLGTQSAAASPVTSKTKTVKNLFGVKALLRFDHVIKFDALFALEDVAEEHYNGLHCLKVFGRRHSAWLSFTSKQAKFKWMAMLLRHNKQANERTIQTKEEDVENSVDREMGVAFPCFVPDDFSTRCLLCDAQFTIMTRKHHCYFCGTLACAKCTDRRLTNAWKPSEIVRVCVQCHAKYKDREKNSIAANLPLDHRASVWKASHGPNLHDDNSHNDRGADMVPMISPSCSPTMQSVQATTTFTTTPPPPPLSVGMHEPLPLNLLVSRERNQKKQKHYRENNHQNAKEIEHETKEEFDEADIKLKYKYLESTNDDEDNAEMEEHTYTKVNNDNSYCVAGGIMVVVGIVLLVTLNRKRLFS